eukprot:3847689-Prymnesium_polylepis.1
MMIAGDPPPPLPFGRLCSGRADCCWRTSSLTVQLESLSEIERLLANARRVASAASPPATAKQATQARV